MDRPLHKHEPKIALFKKFEYTDLFPYSIAMLMLAASVYLINAFIVITQNMR